jgi:hypothetical protein
MARASSIYLVWIDGEPMPVAAFTVKREAFIFVDRTFSTTDVVKIYAAADGRNSGWREVKRDE